MERDLGISKMLTLNPLLWNLLELLALNKPALCYSSVIIRLFFIFITLLTQTKIIYFAIYYPNIGGGGTFKKLRVEHFLRK